MCVNDKGQTLEPSQVEEEKLGETIIPSSIAKSTNNFADIPEASEAEEGPQSTPRKEENKWDRNSSMPPQMMKRWFGKHDAQELTYLFKIDLIAIG